MRSKLGIMILSVFFAQSTVAGDRHAPQGAAVEIWVPGEHVGSKRNRLSVVGFSTAPSLRLYLNGELWGDLAVRDSIFHSSVRLPYGLNTIRVVAATSDSATYEPAEDSVEVLCGPSVSREQHRIFEDYSFHNRVSPDRCLVCHADDGSSEAAASRADWCYPCHNMVRQRLRQHVIDDRRPCTGCHKIERDLTAKVSSSPADRNPCHQCHKDKIGTFAQDYVHGPVAGGSCTICHDPHGSQFAMTLVRPVPVLCEACHLDVSGEKRPYQHYPFEQGWCINCHDPHATNNRWVLLKTGQDLCFDCHFGGGTARTHQHPYGVKPKKKLAPQLKLAPNGKMECLTCHEPHAADAVFMLRTDKENICLGCHQDVQ